MSLSAFVDYAEANGILRPAVVVHRGKRAVAVCMDLGYLFAGGNAADDRVGMEKCIQYAAVLFDGTFTKFDVLSIHELICKYMGEAFSTKPADVISDTAQAEKMGLVLNINGEELINAA